MNRKELTLCALTASISLVVAATFHAFLPGFGAAFKPLLWPLLPLAFCVRARAAIPTAFAVPLLSAAVNGMPDWATALTLAALAGVGVAALAGLRACLARKVPATR